MLDHSQVYHSESCLPPKICCYTGPPQVGSAFLTNVQAEVTYTRQTYNTASGTVLDDSQVYSEGFCQRHVLVNYICRAKGLERCWTGLITREALAELDAGCGHDAE